MKNIYPFESKVSHIQRLKLHSQSPKVVWFTGLSGSGKSTLASHLEFELFSSGFKTYLLDGDNIRGGLNNDLGFSDSDRQENIRRIGEVSKLFIDAGIIVLSAFISPFEKDRDIVKQIVGIDNLIEVFIDCPLEVCEHRDTKGLYKKARSGELKNFTGIDSAYEIPVYPDITIATDVYNIQQSVQQLCQFILPKIDITKMNQPASNKEDSQTLRYR